MGHKASKLGFQVLEDSELKGLGSLRSKLKGIFTSENQGIALHQDFALFMECKNRVQKLSVSSPALILLKNSVVSLAKSGENQPKIR